MTGKKTLGRPTKFKAEYVEQARKLCLLGATDAQLADFFSVDVATINRWKHDHADFCDSLKSGKNELDEQVKKSLFHRAMGYSHPEDKIFCNKDGKVTTEETTKHYAPDTTACIFWLKNRQPKDWRDKVQTEISNPDGSLQPTGNPEMLAKLNRIIENAKIAKASAEQPEGISAEDESAFI